MKVKDIKNGDDIIVVKSEYGEIPLSWFNIHVDDINLEKGTLTFTAQTVDGEMATETIADVEKYKFFRNEEEVNLLTESVLEKVAQEGNELEFFKYFMVLSSMAGGEDYQ